MRDEVSERLAKSVLAYGVAGLIFLAGFIEIGTALASHRLVLASIGVIFVGAGSVWLAAGARFHKQAKQLK